MTAGWWRLTGGLRPSSDPGVPAYTSAAMLRSIIRSLRPRQWVKNLFVLAPLVFALGLERPGMLARSLVAFVAFCALASAVYLINDLRDRERDRLHPLKRNRPIASGAIGTRTAILTALALIVLSIVLGSTLGVNFVLLLVSYLLLNLLYTFSLKKIVILDVMAVSFCYVLRVMAGAVAIDVDVSRWLLLCTVLLALFLAFSKRRHELSTLVEGATSTREVLGDYSLEFLDQMINVVTASTLICYVLYTMDPNTIAKFGTEDLIYTVPFVLFGIFRYLFLIHRATDERNPTESMLSDGPFVFNLVLWAAVVIFILYVSGTG